MFLNKQRECPIHKKKSEFFCLKLQCNKETTRFICQSCIDLGPHKNHEIISVIDLQANSRYKVEQFYKRQEDLNKKDIEQLDKIEQKYKQKLGEVKKRLVQSFEQMEQKLSIQLQETKIKVKKNLESSLKLKLLSEINFESQKNQTECIKERHLEQEQIQLVQVEVKSQGDKNEFEGEQKKLQVDQNSLFSQVQEQKSVDEYNLVQIEKDFESKRELQYDLARIMKESKGLISCQEIAVSYYEQFLGNVEVIGSQWSLGFLEYFENFEKSLSQQLAKLCEDSDDLLESFNLSEFRGQEWEILKGHTNRVYSFFVMNNLYGDKTDLLVSCSSDSDIMVWDIQKKICIKIIQEEQNDISFYCLEKITEKKFAAGTSNNEIIIYEYFEKVAILAGHKENVNVLAKVPNQNQILSGSDDKSIILWDTEQYEKIMAFEGHKDIIDNNMLICLDENQFVSVSQDMTIRVWQKKEKIVINHQFINLFENGVTSPPNCIAFFQENIVLTGHNNLLAAWDIQNLQCIYQEEFLEGINVIKQIDDNLFALGTCSDIIKIISVHEKETEIQTSLVKILKDSHEEDQIITFITRYKNNKIISGSADDNIVIWC